MAYTCSWFANYRNTIIRNMKVDPPLLALGDHVVTPDPTQRRNGMVYCAGLKTMRNTKT